MDIVILTGYTKEQFDEMLEKDQEGGCYLCKRKVSEKGVFFMGTEDDPEIGACLLDFKWVERVDDGRKFRFPLCNECLLLLEGFTGKQNPLFRLIERPNLN